MGDKTKIEWCDSTFNPWIGCTAISPACDNCYAEAMMDTRMRVVKWGVGNPRKRTSPKNWKLPVKWNANSCWFIQCGDCGWRGDSGGALCGSCHSQNTSPARRRVFCASLADVFDSEVNSQWRTDLFRLIESTPNLDWLLLTKRIGNAAEMLDDIATDLSYGSFGWEVDGKPMLPNVWLGATICNQKEADRDMPKLLAIPARIRFLSIEPMLGPIDLNDPVFMDRPSCFYTYENYRPGQPRDINWVIVGGESGSEARPMHPDWVRSLRDQCADAGVPFLFKQWGEHAPNWFCNDDGKYAGGPVWMDRMGKRLAGRTLDGRTHDEFPEATA